MTVDVTERSLARTDTDLEGVRVTTTDAAGTTREYDISLTPDRVDGAYVLAGRRVDEDTPEDQEVVGPSETAWQAAAEHFQDEGYEVFGR